MQAGILGYGIYIPKYRINISDIALAWNKNSQDLASSLRIKEKSVASADEDTVTLAYEASSLALKHAGMKPSLIESCLIGSESHPYAVNPTSTIVAEFLGVGRNYVAVDLEFACKAATTGLILTLGLIESGRIKNGLVVGADVAQAKPHDILEYTAASASAAYILGSDEKEVIAKILATSSFTSDTPDFWRRDGVKFPTHGGRFTGEPSYFTHVEGAARMLFQKTKLSPDDFDYCVFHMPNGKFPREVAKRLGFTDKQQQHSLVVDHIGNPYSASSLIGLAATLDTARPGERIFMVSYGSGAGSDGFVIQVEKAILKKRDRQTFFKDYLKNTKYITYTDYLKSGGKI